MVASAGKYQAKFYTKEIKREMEKITSKEEKATAGRILKRLFKRTPEGKRTRRHHKTGKAWQTRSPGREPVGRLDLLIVGETPDVAGE